MKRIVSLWLPGWPVTCLAGQEPQAVPGDKPFALVVSGVHGLAISALNAAGQSAGLRVGTALADARAAVPELVSRPARAADDQAALLRLARWAGRYGPNRNVDGADGLWIDITGVAHLFGGEEALLDDLSARLAALQIPARAGLGCTLSAAHALARFSVGPRDAWALAPQGQGAGVLAPLPVEALRISPDAAVLLKRLGLRRIGQLYDLPRESLARRFRSSDIAGAVLTRLDQALGSAAEPLKPLSEPPVLAVERAFAEPLISSEALEAVTGELADELCDLLKDKDLGATAVRLSLYRADGTVAQARITVRRPCRDGRHVLELLREKMSALDAGFGIDLLVLEALRAARLKGAQPGFAEDEDWADYDPGLLIDRLSNRLGIETVTVLAARASHIPERAEIRVPALAAAPSTRPAYEPPWPYGPGPRRPSFMLPRPEPIAVVAGVPDGPPARFIWRRVERRVARAQGPERIAPEWWRAIGLGEAQKRPRPRDYFEIEDETGAAYWVFRRGLYGGDEAGDEGDPPTWFLHGLFA